MSAKILYDLGLWEYFKGFQKIRGIRIFVEDQGFQEFKYPESLEDPGYGIVVPRLKLDHLLRQKAIESGVEVLENAGFKNLIYDSAHTIIGISLQNNAGFFSDVVIGADGAASKIAYEANLATTPKSKLGFGIRAYFSGGGDVKDNLEIYLPILDSSDKYVLPSYGWIFPVDNNLVNVGIGLATKQETDNVNSVLDMFVEKLRNTDHRLKNMKMEGKAIGAPMRFDFAPHKSYAPGLLLVGDAAGMISPFTGEGIGYAMETGKIAADVYVQAARSDPRSRFRDLTRYGDILSKKYQGYFETGTHSVNRYHFIWKVLKNTFRNEKQLFQTVRQATLFPEAIGESFFNHLTPDVSSCFTADELTLKTDLILITENLINITRQDWPFLSRLFTASQATPGIPLNPTLFLLLTGNMFTPDRNKLIQLGTAMELGYAAVLCHNSIGEDQKNGTSTPVNWGNMLSILLGDFLLSKCYEMTSHLDGNAVVISRAMGLSSEGFFKLNRMIENSREITITEYLDLVYLKNSSLFELCMYLGSVNSYGGMKDSTSLSEFGKYFGAAFQIVEEIRMLSQKRKSLKVNNIYINMVSEALNLPQLCRKSSAIGSSAGNICMLQAMELAKNEIAKAREQIKDVSNGRYKQILFGISDFLIAQGMGLAIEYVG